jgi:hypothetical protein
MANVAFRGVFSQEPEGPFFANSTHTPKPLIGLTLLSDTPSLCPSPERENSVPSPLGEKDRMGGFEPTNPIHHQALPATARGQQPC